MLTTTAHLFAHVGADSGSLTVELLSSLPADGAEPADVAAGAELTAALKQAHAKSGKYAQERMAQLYGDMGLAMGPPQ